jgi:hypothetical protein
MQWTELMPIARSPAPSVASGRGGKSAQPSSAPVIGSLDEDAQMMLFAVGNRGELPGEYSGRPNHALLDEEPESPYWATWGF